ncbi:unnamed protein product [Lymnaea stagnalis]|uniref:Uncharacterized protein n=1 Tax=Lymnaea stagnalis TaxID=6523 RepID=A0AAV2I7P5_LYMST
MTAFSGLAGHHVASPATGPRGGGDVTAHVSDVSASGNVPQRMDTDTNDSRTVDLYDGGDDEEDDDDDEETLVVNIISPECCRRSDPASGSNPPLSLPRAAPSPPPAVATPMSGSPRASPNPRTMTSPSSAASFYGESTSSPRPRKMASPPPAACPRKMSPPAPPNPRAPATEVPLTPRPPKVSPPPLSHTLQEPPPKKSSSSAAKSSSSRSLPIHCVIEQAESEDDAASMETQASVILDTYAILPGATLFSEIITASLSKLGYSSGETTGAKGGLQLKNWKTLSFSAVTDHTEATVEEILGEITSVATLRIKLLSRAKSSSSSDDVKGKLLQLLLTKSKDFLLQAGCPIEQSLLEAISTGDTTQCISDHICSSFNDWYTQQKGSNLALSVMSAHSTPSVMPVKPSPLASSDSSLATPKGKSIKKESKCDSPSMMVSPQTPSMAASSPQANSPAIVLSAPMTTDHLIIKTENVSNFQPDLSDVGHALQFSGRCDAISPQCNKSLTDKSMDRNTLRAELYKISRSPGEGNIPSTLQSHPANPYLGLMPGKTRIRTSFDPEHEIPRLQKWFTDNQHPTREQMMRFMQELNGLESRKGRRPLDLTNIIYWFKNARAAQRRATKALDDSFENEENVDMNSAGSGNSVTDCVPPYLPNKNAVYMIPFHPYPHLMTGSHGDSSGITSGAGVDEPYDLSITKRPSEISKIANGKEDKTNKHGQSHSESPSPTKSSSASSESESRGETNKKKKIYCTPRFPALLDVASKMHQEIPARSNDVYHGNGNQSGGRTSPCRSGSSDMEHSSKHDDMSNSFSGLVMPIINGTSAAEHFLSNLKIKHENGDQSSREHNCSSRGNYRHPSHNSRDSGLELGQVKKEHDRMDCSDDDNSDDSYNSEEELKMRMKQNASVVVDYASAMHNNVSRLTAANMAALSLAQMGQSLHIPQLPPSLAMAYYPMDPRFYSQTGVQHSLSSSPPSSLAATHPSHLSQLSLRQTQDPNPHVDSRSPLSSPSSMQQSMNQMNHHHHHHQNQQHHQRQSPQEHHHSHHSEPRKRRTRVFIDPLTEIPKLEKWFTEDTHPSAFMIDKYCEELNKCEYRHKFPKLEPKNVQLWFKNHRAKVKRMKVSYDGQGDPDGHLCLDDDMDD